MNIFFILISSILYAVSFPKFNFWWCAFISLVPFFQALENADSGRKTILYGILWGIGHAAGMGYWVFITTLTHYEVPFARSVLFFCLCVAVPVIIIYTGVAVLYRLLHANQLFFYALVVPSLWVLAEYLKSAFSFLIPWGGLAYALVPFSAFVQIADIVGGDGILFIVAAVNSLFVYSIRHLSRRTSGDQQPTDNGEYFHPNGLYLLVSFGLIILLIGAPFFYGVLRLRKIDAAIIRAEKGGRTLQAVLVQGNFSTKERWSGMGFYQRVKRYLELSGEQSKDFSDDEAAGTDANTETAIRRVIVWPETILNSSSRLTDQFFVELMRYIGKESLLISGGLKSDTETDAVFNSAYFISGTGRLLRYDKHILLPYSETSPFIDLLDRYYHAPSEFEPGRTPTSIDAPGGRVGTSICFEVLYSGFVREAVRDGAVYLVNISNDSWFGDSPMPYIHLNAARLRAIENRRFLLRASNSGISALIAPSGEIIAKSGLFTKERVDGAFATMDRLSVYTRFGNMFLAASIFILMAALIRVIIKTR